MSLRVDVKRKQQHAIERLERLLTSHNCSARCVVVDGYCAGAVAPIPDATPASLDLVGSMYAPALGVGSGAPTAPAITLTVLPGQVPALLSTAPIMLITAGQRSGKTHLGVVLALLTACRKSDARVGYLVPAWTKIGVIEPLMISLGGGVIRQYHTTAHRWTLWNGSTIQAFSVTSGSREQTSYLGYEFDLVIIEEYREVKNPADAFQNAYSRIISRAGRLVIVSSPEVGHPLERMAEGWYNGAAIEVHNLSALENPYAKPDAKDPEKYFRLAKQLYPSDVYARNVEGRYVQDLSVDYSEFDRIKHVAKPTQTDITGSLYLTQHYLGRISKILRKKIQSTDSFSAIVGLDMGLNNSGVIISVHVPSGQQPNSVSLAYHVRAEIKGHDNEGLVGFLNQLRRHPLLAALPPSKVLVCCDPYSAQARSVVDGKTAFQVLAAAGYKTLFDRYSREVAREAVNSKFRAGQLTIDPGCSTLIESLLKFKDAGRGQKALSKDKYGHFIDALKAAVSVLSPWHDIEAHVLSQIYGTA